MDLISLITWDDFEKVRMVAGTILRAEVFPEARKPAYKLWVDIGDGVVKQSSAQITSLYTPEELIGKQVLCVVNFPARKVGPFTSEILVCGFYRADGTVVLAVPDKQMDAGSKLG